MNTPPTHRTDFHPAPSQKKTTPPTACRVAVRFAPQGATPRPRAAHRSDPHHKEPHPRPRAARTTRSHTPDRVPHTGPIRTTRGHAPDCVPRCGSIRTTRSHTPDCVPRCGSIRTTRSHTPTACCTPVRFAPVVATAGGVGVVELHLSLGSARERWGAHSPGGRRAVWRAARLAGTHEGGSILAGVLDRTKSGFMLDGAPPTAPSLLPPGSTGPSRRPGGGIRRFGGPRRGRAGCASTAGWPANRRRSGWGPR